MPRYKITTSVDYVFIVDANNESAAERERERERGFELSES
jgi:hypothetical protein